MNSLLQTILRDCYGCPHANAKANLSKVADPSKNFFKAHHLICVEEEEVQLQDTKKDEKDYLDLKK